MSVDCVENERMRGMEVMALTNDFQESGPNHEKPYA
jgi:hypothetical protein